MIVQQDIRHYAHKRFSGYQDILTTPAPLNTWLWFVAVKTDSGFFAGYHSVFQSSRRADLHFFPSSNAHSNQYSETTEFGQLEKFSRGWYTLERRHDTLIFNDLRFGQVIGWHDPNQGFAFSYYLNKPASANKLVVQRGRFKNWSKASTLSMVEKIRGSDTNHRPH